MTVPRRNTNNKSSARASAARPQHAPSTAARNSLGSSQSAIAAHRAAITVRPVTVSDITRPAFTQMFGLSAAMPAAINPTVSPPMRRPKSPIRNTSSVPSTAIA